MKFDAIVIGGGLSALTAGISLAKAGKRTAVVAAGQSMLHFNTGAFDLLQDGDENRLTAGGAEALPEGHPYHKVHEPEQLAQEAVALLKEASIPVVEAGEGVLHFTPTGEVAPTWLTVEGVLTAGNDALKGKKLALVNIEGYLDFPIDFLKPALEAQGATVVMKQFTTAELENARRSQTEFRATNISKYLDDDEALQHVADCLNEIADDEQGVDALVLPATFIVKDMTREGRLAPKVKTPLVFLPTMHPSAIGKQIAALLRQYFVSLGGEFFLSDQVERGDIENGRLLRVFSHNMAEEPLEADDFVLATGSFMSRGLASNYQEVWEPIFRLDVDAADKRPDWHNDQFFSVQPFMSFGVRTDDALHALKDGKAIGNLYVAGSVLSGNDFTVYGDREGVDLLTALQVAHNILKK